ncbi:MAG: hypothetical protein RL172_1472 [Bacteroidota bacterium]|jgi:hypothetical protein
MLLILWKAYIFWNFFLKFYLMEMNKALLLGAPYSFSINNEAVTCQTDRYLKLAMFALYKYGVLKQ